MPLFFNQRNTVCIGLPSQFPVLEKAQHISLKELAPQDYANAPGRLPNLGRVTHLMELMTSVDTIPAALDALDLVGPTLGSLASSRLGSWVAHEPSRKTNDGIPQTTAAPILTRNSRKPKP